MPKPVGIFTDDRELSEIIRLILARNNRLPTDVMEGPLHSADLVWRQCMIVDWLQMDGASRHAVLAWERELAGILVDVSGVLTPGGRRHVFSPPFAWEGFCDVIRRSAPSQSVASGQI